MVLPGGGGEHVQSIIWAVTTRRIKPGQAPANCPRTGTTVARVRACVCGACVGGCALRAWRSCTPAVEHAM